MSPSNKSKTKAVMAIFAAMAILNACKGVQFLGVSDSQKGTILNNGKLTYKRTALSEKNLLLKWAHMDIVKDSIPGISLEKAKQVLAEKKATPTVVAIIDSGTDITHGALNSLIWTNPKEVPGNQKDDDGNGYTDDIHGWNFLGETYGAPYTLTRLVRRCEEVCSSKENSSAFCKQCPELRQIYEEESNRASEAYSNIISFYNEATASENTRAYYRHVLDQNQYHYNTFLDPREIIGDDVDNINDRYYGNPNVLPQAKTETHGTHVTGIVVQITGQFTDDIKIMPIRSTPNGDEYDKDVALAIRYAVDNGAKVINMSFGKSYSENLEWVKSAIRYAAEKDVLLVHAAGNDGKNIDVSKVYPDDTDESGQEIADNMISVGAITRFFNEALVPDFSNYGKANVDVFAPGSKIYSMLPKNDYGYQQGTSMAAPTVAGVAGLIRSYYPKLPASQVKQIIMDSGVAVPFEVYVPGRQGEKTPFSELCKSGKILNAYNALLMARITSKFK